jgi:hypothetical protein
MLNRSNPSSGRRSKPPLLAFSVVALQLGANAAVLQAAPVTYTAGGTLSSVDPSLAGTFSIGDPFQLMLTYDDATPDSLPANMTFGSYSNAVLSLSGTIGAGYAFSWSPPAAPGNVSTINIPVDDVMDIIISDVSPSGWTGASVAGLDPEFGNFPFFDGDGPGGFLGTDALPTAPPTFGQIAAGIAPGFRIRFGPTPNVNEIAGEFSFLVPEPTALALAVLSLCAGLSARRR